MCVFSGLWVGTMAWLVARISGSLPDNVPTLWRLSQNCRCCLLGGRRICTADRNCTLARAFLPGLHRLETRSRKKSADQLRPRTCRPHTPVAPISVGAYSEPANAVADHITANCYDGGRREIGLAVIEYRCISSLLDRPGGHRQKAWDPQSGFEQLQ